MKLSDMQLFRGLKEEEIASLLSCLSSLKRNYKKGEVILSEGSITENIGIVLSGMAMISCNDIWGNTSILGNVAPGSVFAEVYACYSGTADVGYSVCCGRYLGVVYECRPCPDCLHKCLPFSYKSCAKFTDSLCSQKSAAFAKNLAYRFQIHTGTIDVLFFGMCKTCRKQFFSDPI